jgi:hypothetical protein
MFTQAPEITIDATVGQVVVQPTSTPTPTSTSTGSSTSSTSTPTSVPSVTPISTKTPVYTYPTIPPSKQFKQQALTIYGYGPVNSEVTLKGFGVSQKVISDDDGLFRFSEIYSLSITYPELCVQAIDQQNRTTQPSCIPALPNDSLIPLEVGPILLSPTISISESRVKEGESAVLSGQTTPNTKVNIYLSKKEGATTKISIVKNANAYTLPTVEILSNEKGEYEVSLPTGDFAEYKLFASTKFGEYLSAKSNTLTFVVLTELKTFFQRLIDLIIENKIIAFILLEAVVFILLFIQALKSTTKRKRRHNEREYLEEVISLR